NCCADSGAWTLVTIGNGQYITGGNSGIDSAGSMAVLGGALYQMTGDVDAGFGSEVFKYTDYEGQSYALKFQAASDNAGVSESANLPNTASIYFAAEQQAVNNGGDSVGGTFVMTHGISTSAGAYDVAEDFPTRDFSFAAGEIATVDEAETGFVKKSTSTYDKNAVGIYSTKPGFRLSQLTLDSNSKAVPIALAGRVPVKVSASSEAIHPGDYLTTSNDQGRAMKATKAGQMIGKALEAWTPESGKDSVLVFVTVTYSDPNNVLESISLDDDGKLMVSNVSSSSIALPEGLVIDGNELTGNLDDALLAITNNLATSSANFEDIFAELDDIASKSADLDTKVASIEAEIASSSATLADAHSLAQNAVESITGLGERLSDFIASFSDTTPDLNLTPTETLIASGSATLTNIDVASDAKIAGNLTAYSAIVEDTFKVLGKSDLTSDVTVGGTLSMNGSFVNGMLSIADNSINVIGIKDGEGETITEGTLYLQNSLLADSIDMFNGAVIINKEGTLFVRNDINLGGSLNIEGAITTSATAGEDLKAGDVLYISEAGIVKKADVTDIQRITVIGISAKDSVAGTKATVVIAGKIKGLTDLVAGKKYYLGLDGGLVETLPENALKGVQLGIAFSTDELIMQISEDSSASVIGVSTSTDPKPVTTITPPLSITPTVPVTALEQPATPTPTIPEP
ncbi:MAG: hypothetical protein ABIO02_02365, partial [Patescibacteria group bacterium]